MKKLFVFTIDCEYIAVKDGKTLRVNVLVLNALVLNSCAVIENKDEIPFYKTYRVSSKELTVARYANHSYKIKLRK